MIRALAVTATASRSRSRRGHVRVVTQGRSRPFRCGPALLVFLLGSRLAGVDRAYAGTLFAPEYLPCGNVSINGVFPSRPNRISWDWGDGFVQDSVFPGRHEYSVNGDFHIHVSAFIDSTLVDSAVTLVHIQSADDPLCAYSVRLDPTTVALRSGSSSRQLTVDVRGAAGEPISLDDKTLSFTSSNPALVQVTATGMVSSSGFGETRVTASVSGLPRTATALVAAGDFRLEPPIVLLTPGAKTTVKVQAFNADGSALSGHGVHFIGANVVAKVTDAGVITGLRPPQAFTETPLVFAVVDGLLTSHNGVVVRVTSHPLGLTLRDEPGQYVSFRFADQVGTLPFGALLTELQATTVLDGVYRFEHRLTGVTPNRGDRQYLVMDPGVDADGTVPCGINGNPIRLGVGVDNLRSCLGGTDFLQWGVMSHEMGHNFLSMTQRAFADLVAPLADKVTFVEGVATFLGMAAQEELLRIPTAYGLHAETVANLSRSDIPLTPSFCRRVFFPELAAYESSPDFAKSMNADLLDGILIRLYDEFGAHFALRLLSAFVPADDPLPVNLANEGKALAFFAAACSAAAGTDLKTRFQTRWGFPLDSSFYDAIYPQVIVLVARREGGIFSDCLTTPPGPACLQVTSVSPVSGPIGGGTLVTVRGDGFVAEPTVTVGGVAATGVVVAGPASLTAVTGAHATGLADVTVTIPGALSATLAEGFFYAPPPTPSHYYTLTPCRLVDTRTAQAPALAASERRVFTIAGGPCAVPVTAKAVAVNITVVGGTASGHIRLAPGNGLTETSAINFSQGQTRANNGVVRLATDGTGGISATNRSSGAVHLVLDVSGYFE